MVIAKESRQTLAEVAKWSFSADGKPLGIDEFLESFRKQGVFFEGKEQWLKGVIKVTWENFFLVCTEELDDISQRAAKMLILYCLEIVEDTVSRLKGSVTPARIADAMKREFDRSQFLQGRATSRGGEALVTGLGSRHPGERSGVRADIFRCRERVTTTASPAIDGQALLNTSAAACRSVTGSPAT